MQERLRAAIARIDRLSNKVTEITRHTQPLFDGNKILAESDIIEILGVSARTLQTWRTTGKISYIALGGKIVYLSSDIQAMLMDNYRNK